ncbi:MAG: dihydropteroate synthase, partial [Oscillospiraceae bacterium]|nr:dihydropteroate synthase [Candidatus Equicaccousia limihippi]
VFAKTVRLGAKYDADLITLETFNDLYELKAAIIAVKENCDLPFFVSCAFSGDRKLMTGADALTVLSLAESMGACAVGLHCSYGPKALYDTAKEFLRYASVPVIFKPNAGIPSVKNGETVFDINAVDFANECALLVKEGVRIVGGCCGTTPEYIRELSNLCKDIAPTEISPKNQTVVTSYDRAVIFGERPILIGEKINPTGKKRFKQALVENDINYVLKEAVAQTQAGANALDVNVGTPETDEINLLYKVVGEIQTVTDLPLQIDSSDPKALEKAMRIYNGKPLINSVGGKAESMQAIFPLVKKYGGTVIALTLDENGIPTTADGRFEIAKKIKDTAADFGILPKDIIFDPLTMTVSADNNAAAITLKTLKMITEKLGCKTVLGVSNVSFGLPCRDTVNAAFFAAALQNGLSAAILNPFSHSMMQTYYTYNLLAGLDPNCGDYLAFCENNPEISANGFNPINATANAQTTDLKEAVIKGLKEEAKNLTAELLKTREPLQIVNGEIIPALDIVGKAFEEKTVFLPQLLMCAESAGAAFEIIKEKVPAKKDKQGFKIVLATVKGDIHDIGKNIVKLLLENYGFEVMDLGKDVEPQTVVDAVIKSGAALAGLSTLMTTTGPAMAETVKLIHAKAPFCKVVVGGAVLTPEYAKSFEADFYCADAMETVHCAKALQNNK